MKLSTLLMHAWCHCQVFSASKKCKQINFYWFCWQNCIHLN